MELNLKGMAWRLVKALVNRPHITRIRIVFQIFTIKELEKIPDFQLVTPPQEVMQLPRKGAQPWENVETDLRDLCERALERLKQKISKRRILLRPQFQDYDPYTMDHSCDAVSLYEKDHFSPLKLDEPPELQ
uniref:Uncharacterized protein n=1 Tax=Timema tahoe TaxID=61484 RepID=A0A7R9IP03_9NEOP|nr:unnamed protein product [Timema tahoe]